MADSDEPQPAQRAQAGLGLGERLRSARKARALSVTQVAEALHLEEPMVLALEEECFDVLGAPVFVRGHLRRYAQLVGLVPDAVLEAYRTAVPESVAPPSLARARIEPERVRIGSWVFWVLGAVLVAGLVIVLGSGRKPVEPASDEPSLEFHSEASSGPDALLPPAAGTVRDEPQAVPAAGGEPAPQQAPAAVPAQAGEASE